MITFVILFICGIIVLSKYFKDKIPEDRYKKSGYEEECDNWKGPDCNRVD